MENTEIILKEETVVLAGLRTIKAAAGGLDRTLQSLQQRLDGIFNGMTLAQYLSDAVKATGKLDKELLVMRLALGKLRMAIGDAFVPIGQVVLPLINDAIFAVLRFVRSAGKIIHALFGVESSASDAADAEYAYASAVSTASKAAQRSLASFDKLNRLQKSTGSGSGSSVSVPKPDNYKMNLDEFLIFNTISNMLAPLKEIDLTPITNALKKLREALRPIDKQLFEGLRWAWDNIFVPIIEWSAEILLPEVINTLSVAMDALNRVIEACKPALTFLWENFLKPLGQWAAQYLLSQLESFQQKLNNMADWVEKFPPSAQGLLVWFNDLAGGILSTDELLALFDATTDSTAYSVSNFAATLWSMASPFGQLGTQLFGMLDGLCQLTAGLDDAALSGDTASNRLLRAWGGVSSWFSDNVFEPLKSGFRDTGNGILGIFGGVSSGATTGFNALIEAINSIKFTIPDWIPFIGGKKFGFDLPTLKTPFIPWLAKGAVLPANKPFLAMVGDQRHGTNVEAPLSTIQDAVRIELQDMIDSNLAGQETIAGVLRQILEAVLGISITDGDIAGAADHYYSKMAVVRGGGF